MVPRQVRRFAASRWTLAVALAALGLALALPAQPPGCSQTAHYALIRSLARGEPEIDRYHWQTCDKSYIDGHFYANKAPLLDFLGVPAWLALHALGADDHLPTSSSFAALYDVPASALWPLTVLTAAIPALLLVLLVTAIAGHVAPGYGAATGIAIGVGTLIFPFATILISHALAALLGFAAFALLFGERDRTARISRVVTAGLLAGLAVVTEYPLALVALALGIYTLRRGELVRRGLAYLAGAIVGVAPLVAYNVWAFGSPHTLSYTNTVLDQGQSGHDRVGALAEGFYGISAPSPEVGIELLLAQKGLLVVTPVVAAAFAGLVLLARKGFGPEAVLVGGLSLAFVVYLAGYAYPFGGDGPGPRFFTPLLPFLALPLACAFERRPLATGALGLASAVTMLLAVTTEPLLGSNDTDHWASRALDGDFAQTALSLAGVDRGWVAVAPVLLLAVVALVVAAATLPRRPVELADGRLALVALLAWAVVAATAARALTPDVSDDALTVTAVALAGVACALAGIAAERLSRHTPV